METFKIENFLRENPSQEFPRFVSLDAAECASLRSAVATAMGLGLETEPLALLTALQRSSTPLNVNAAADEFRLADLLRFVGVTVMADVFINWNRFDNIDRIALSDLSSHFGDIYYPGPDDIEIFDASMQWFLLLDHDGNMSWVKPESPELEWVAINPLLYSNPV